MPQHFKKPMAEPRCVGASCEGCADAMCMAKGGQIGVHDDLGDFGGPKGVSPAGRSVREMNEGTYKKYEGADPKQSHEKVLSELRSMKKPNLYAEGGEVMDEPDMDEEIHGMLGEELMAAFESKDKKRVMECLEAAVLSCMNKRGEM